MANSIQIRDLPVANVSLPQLESIYKRYGSYIYSLCFRLLADEKAAESTTVDVFVRFNKELGSQSDEPRISSRLHEMAVAAALSRLREHSMTAVLYRLRDVLLRLRRRWFAL